jgi:hypothetical protein
LLQDLALASVDTQLGITLPPYSALTDLSPLPLPFAPLVNAGVIQIDVTEDAALADVVNGWKEADIPLREDMQDAGEEGNTVGAGKKGKRVVGVSRGIYAQLWRASRLACGEILEATSRNKREQPWSAVEIVKHLDKLDERIRRGNDVVLVPN